MSSTTALACHGLLLLLTAGIGTYSPFDVVRGDGRSRG